MHIILGQEPAEKLRENYTILELETFVHNGQEIPAFCVVDQVPLGDLPVLDQHVSMHNSFLTEYKNKNFDKCMELVSQLKGKFNGDLDSFYDELMNRVV